MDKVDEQTSGQLSSSSLETLENVEGPSWHCLGGGDGQAAQRQRNIEEGLPGAGVLRLGVCLYYLPCSAECAVDDAKCPQCGCGSIICMDMGEGEGVRAR